MNFVTSGKKGDLIMALYVIKRMGGGNLFIDKGEFEEPLSSVIDSCEKLVSSQDYIRKFAIYNGEKIDVNLDYFRKSQFMYRKTLLEIIAKFNGLELEDNVPAWINVEAKQEFKDKIIIHHRKTSNTRRVNSLFDWEQLFDNFGIENVVFVSRLRKEWEEFGNPDLAYYCPIDNYEHAEIIKAARYFIGNQSFPSALADALNVPRIFELATGSDRNHFAINYSENSWYYASPWNKSIYNFRYLKKKNKNEWLDIVNNEVLHTKPEVKNNYTHAFMNEIKYYYRYIKSILLHNAHLLKFYFTEKIIKNNE